MRKLVLPLIVLMLTGLLFAQPNEDSILIIPKTSIPPVIDGELDTLAWNYVAETLVDKMDAGDAVEPDDWFDLFGSLRLMFDDDNLYIWLEVQDDIYNTEGGNHEYDGVDIYFDADNSKTEAAYDGIDDIQLRFNLGEETIEDVDVGYGGAADWGFVKDGIEYMVVESDYGWNAEISIPLADLQLEPGLDFGFDIQINDADESTRENMYRWWSDNNDEWHHAELFGTALLWPDRVLKEVLEIPKGEAPTIDGMQGTGEWADAVPVSASRLDASAQAALYDHVEGPWDCRAWAWMKWDADNFYYYLKVWDDYYDIAEDEDSNWEFDSIELFFDADNSDTAPYDGIDDIQIRYNVGQTETDQIDMGYGQGDDWGWARENVSYVVLETDVGWDVEVASPLVDLQIEPGVDWGFEMQLNDCDDPDITPNRTMYRWWAPGEPTWSDASLFGTVMLTPPFASVERVAGAVAGDYELTQNYPNPFNPTTSIDFSVPKRSNVQLEVYDLLGKKVATLVNEVKVAGKYTASFDGANLASGVYIYKLITGEKVLTQKMMLIK